MSRCVICSSEDANDKVAGDGRVYECPRCGFFFLAGTLVSTLPNKLREDPARGSLLSYAVRKMQREGGDPPPLDSTLVDRLLEGSLPPLNEQADNLVLWLGSHTVPGQQLQLSAATHQSVVGAETPDGFAFVLEYLFDTDILSGNLAPSMGVPTSAIAGLSFDGWSRREELLRGAAGSRRAFMAMQFGDDVLDKMVDETFRPAVKQTGFRLERLNDEPKAGLIDDRLRVSIRTSRFLIADLTHDNNGAYWEAGYAEGLGKPVIYTCEKEKFEKSKSHFDTNHHLTVPWSLEDLPAAAEELKATIRSTLPEEAILSDDEATEAS